jgi:rubrerythrin
VASANRKASWLRYDAKRNGTAERLKKERARNTMRKIKKQGRCELCGDEGPTVWHHSNYDLPAEAIEVCPVCHRRLHPRKMPNGAVC